MEFLPDFSGPLFGIYSIIFWLLILIQLFYLLFFYIRISFYRVPNLKNTSLPPISIIISARNEEENLFENLPLILEQEYDNFEVIVVNHQSLDNTEYILKAFKEKYSHLRVITLERGKHLTYGKKLPLTIGIKGAIHNHLLLTDADCQPTSKQWLREMSSYFSEKKEIVLGYAPIKKEKGLLNRVIRLDTAFIALNYLSFAKAGLPYMGVGRNLAYTKSLFMNNKGFKSHYALQSGDDDLFIQEVATKKNCAISISPSTFCFSEGEKTWKDWFNQKSRHYTTSGRYPLFKKLLLGIYPLSLLLVYVSLFILIYNNGLSWISIIAFLVLLATKWLVLGLAFKKLGQQAMGWSILFWDTFYALFIPIIFYTAEKSTVTKWK